MFPSGNIVLESSKFHENVPGRELFIGRSCAADLITSLAGADPPQRFGGEPDGWPRENLEYDGDRASKDIPA